MPFYEEKDDCLILNIRVIPRASKNEIQDVLGDALKVRIKAPPVAGKANACLIRFLSKQWNIPRAHLEILSGKAGRRKRMRISHPPPDVLRFLRQLG